MEDRIIAALVFVIIWYALVLIGRTLFKPFEKLKLVWCPEARQFSFIEAFGKSEGGRSVKSCLLWPEHKSCNQRCIK